MLAPTLKSAVFGLALPSFCAAQQSTLPSRPCFGRQQFFAAPERIYATLGAQQGVGIGDFDGDGLVDFAGIRDRSGEPHIAFADAGGGFTVVRFTAVTLDWVGDIQAGDIDGDGDLDLAIPSDGYSNGSPGELRIFVNPGAATARSASWVDHTAFAFSDANHINDVRLRDMDGDGKLDVVARSRSRTNRIIVSMQRASLSAWDSFVYPTTYRSVGPEGVHVDDLDGDGVPEVIGDGWFLTPTNLTTPWADGGARQVDWSLPSRWYEERTKLWTDDVNRDGRMDILVVKAENGDGDLSWLECAVDPLQSTPSDWTEHVIAVDVGQMHHVQTADFDGDGDCDVLVGSFRTSTGGLKVFYNQSSVGGGGSVDGWTEDQIAQRGCYHGGVFDQDGDGDPDIVAIDGYRNGLYFYENITPSGQRNGAFASLQVGDAGGAMDRSGPFPVCAAPGVAVDFRWSGTPGGQPVVLAGAALNLGTPAVGCIGSLDVGGPLFALSPTMLLQGPTLDARGSAVGTLNLPAALPPGELALQGFVLQLGGSACPFVATSAFRLQW